VVENFTKVNVSLHRAVETKYVRVLWDNTKNPMEHAQSRLVLADELAQALESYMESLGG
jgi:ATP:corrinoid adenosyltransferase